MDKDLELLRQALYQYKEKWINERDLLDRTEEDIKMYVKYTAMIYMAQWIINSINGGLGVPHGTNICNIIHNKDTKED